MREGLVVALNWCTLICLPQLLPFLFPSKEPCDRETVVYRLEDTLATPTGSSPACCNLLLALSLCPHTHTEEVPDSFFNVTIQDVKNMHDDLKRQV